MATNRASRVLIALVVLGAAGCGEVVTDSYSKWERQREAQHARRLKNDTDMRTQMAAGAFGRDQVLPGGNLRSAASFGRPPKFPFQQTVMRLPSLSEGPVASLELGRSALASPAIEIRRGMSTGTGGGSASGGDSGGGCVYKPVMTAEDIARCR